MRKKPVSDSKLCADCEHIHIGPKDDIGECWRYPAKIIVINDEVQVTRDPADPTETCGEFKRRTN